MTRKIEAESYNEHLARLTGEIDGIRKVAGFINKLTEEDPDIIKIPVVKNIVFFIGNQTVSLLDELLSILDSNQTQTTLEQTRMDLLEKDPQLQSTP